MSINDLLENGIEIQGQTTIKRYVDENDEYITLFEGENIVICDNDIRDKNIKYMYAVYGSGLIIEI